MTKHWGIRKIFYIIYYSPPFDFSSLINLSRKKKKRLFEWHGAKIYSFMIWILKSKYFHLFLGPYKIRIYFIPFIRIQWNLCLEKKYFFLYSILENYRGINGKDVGIFFNVEIVGFKFKWINDWEIVKYNHFTQKSAHLNSFATYSHLVR